MVDLDGETPSTIAERASEVVEEVFPRVRKTEVYEDIIVFLYTTYEPEEDRFERSDIDDAVEDATDGIIKNIVGSELVRQVAEGSNFVMHGSVGPLFPTEDEDRETMGETIDALLDHARDDAEVREVVLDESGCDSIEALEDELVTGERIDVNLYEDLFNRVEDEGLVDHSREYDFMAWRNTGHKYVTQAASGD